MQTGQIGLRAFLFSKGVPKVSSPICPCGVALETPEHLILHCQIWAEPRAELRQLVLPLLLRTTRDLAAITDYRSRLLTQWLLSIGKFSNYKLAEEIGGTRDPEKAKKKKNAAGQA